MLSGLIFDIFLTNGFQALPFIGYSLFFLFDVMMYFLIALLVKAQGFSDKLIFWYSVQVFLYIFIGFFWPPAWYLSTLHFLTMFFSEIIYLLFYRNYDHTAHHIYTILFLTVVLYFTPPIVNVLALPPLINNIVYHGAITFDIIEQTKIFRTIFFVLSRIIYPIIMLFLMFILLPIFIVIKFILAFFALSIVLLMVPKLVKSCQEMRDRQIQHQTKEKRIGEKSRQTIGSGFIEMGLRVVNGLTCFKNDRQNDDRQNDDKQN